MADILAKIMRPVQKAMREWERLRKQREREFNNIMRPVQKALARWERRNGHNA